MSAAERVWLYSALGACVAGIALAVYLLYARIKAQRRRIEEVWRRHLRDVE